MLVAVAVVPGTPLLEPSVAGAAAAELDDLRAACRAALEVLGEAEPEVVVVVGVGGSTCVLSDDARGDLAALALPQVVASLQPTQPSQPMQPQAAASRRPGQTAAGARLPRPHVLGVRLLDAVLPDLPRRAATVSELATANEAMALGASLGDVEPRVAMLVVGDGSAATVEASPAYVVAGAVEADREAARAVGSADLAGIAALTPEWGGRFVVEGRAPWQVAAGAALAVPDRDWHGDLRHDAAPYGVTYLVAIWT